MRVCLGVILAALLAGCSKQPSGSAPPTATPSPPASLQQPWFKEVSSQAGVQFHHQSGHRQRFLIPEMETGGVGLLDYDADGWLDIFCVQGGSLYPDATNVPGHKLFRNLGQWRFEDVTDRAGLGGFRGYGMGVASADYDNDGDTDLYVTNVSTNRLFRNNGDGTFSDATTASGTGHPGWGTSCAFADYDLDGNLDLCIANYLNWSIDREIECFSRGGLPDYCSPLNYKAPAMDALFHNNGDGTFQEATHKAGLDKAYGNGLGVVWADFNTDGYPDIFIANDAMPNQLWMNQRNGTFVDEALIRGCAVNRMGMTEAGMGVVAVDMFQRGSLDLFVTHLVGEGNRLFVNSNAFFMDTVLPHGPEEPSLPFTGWSLGFHDFDNDGCLDLYVANGRVRYGHKQVDPNDPYAEPNTLLRGLGQGRFVEMLPQGGVEPTLVATSRGAAFGDLDNDGAIDIVVNNKDGPIHLLRNIAPKGGNWAMFRLLSREGRNAVGAIARFDIAGKQQWRQVQPNQGYCSSSDPRVHVGLGAATQIDRVTVRWASGTEENYGPFDAGRLYEVREQKNHDAPQRGRTATKLGSVDRRWECQLGSRQRPMTIVAAPSHSAFGLWAHSLDRSRAEN